ncbi:MAG: hypothetical protein JWN17_199 [Frankiales bacterium]|nr:hypothetical protein [Frankiales bacterium]
MPDTSALVWELDGRLLTLFTELGVPFERVEAGAYVVELHGSRRPRTLLWVIAGEQALQIEAFVMHMIAVSDPGPVHRHLLRRNLGLRTVHYSVDDVGDVFLVGSLPHDALSERGIDGVLGEVLSLLEADGPKLQALAYGERLAADAALAAKVRADGAGRRPAGTPEWAPHRDVRR